MPSPSFIVGSTWRTKARFTDEDGDLTDPTTITLKVREPSGTETSYTFAGATVTKEATGIFYRDVTINASGRWVARWIGTGTVADAVEYPIDVPPSQFVSP
jgi:hypothetical protein